MSPRDLNVAVASLLVPLAIAGLVVPAFRRYRWLGAALLLFYVVGYVPLSLAGTYLTENHGGDDWQRSWCPRFLVTPYRAPSGRQRADLSPVGALYWPLLGMDRLLWHRDQEPFGGG